MKKVIFPFLAGALIVLGPLGLRDLVRYTDDIDSGNPLDNARTAKEIRDKVEAEGERFGLSCWRKEACLELVLRAEKNSRLKSALLAAKAAGVTVYPESWYSLLAGTVGPGHVYVNVWHTDERIIAFLTRK